MDLPALPPPCHLTAMLPSPRDGPKTLPRECISAPCAPFAAEEETGRSAAGAWLGTGCVFCTSQSCCSSLQAGAAGSRQGAWPWTSASDGSRRTGIRL